MKAVASPSPEGLDEKVNILIVDDLPEKLLVFSTVLEEIGQNLVFVRSGREALREVLQREFAVILLDVNMPEIDGFETARLIRQYKRSADTPIIFITSYADEIQTERGYAMGAVDYIQAPVVPHILRSKVRVFVRLFALQRQIRRQADAHVAVAAADAARRVAEANDRRSAFLAHASRTLNGSLDVSVGIHELLHLVVPRLASSAMVLSVDANAQAIDPVVVADPDGTTERPRAALAEPAREALLAALGRRRRIDVKGGTGRAALAAIPLVSGSHLHGVLLLAAEGDTQPDDWVILDDLAERAATALENARLYRSLQLEIIERRTAEAELQEASRRKDEFLAMLSHELRNPLAPIRTALEVVRRIAPPDPKFAWASDIMVRQLRQLTRLVEELLDVARISQGKIALKRERVDLNAVIAHSVETAQPSLDARRQPLRVQPFAEPLWLRGDFARLAQILSNLLHNASKYSEDGSPVDLIASVERDAAVIRVRDRGIGIDTDLLPRVFDLFTQGERGLDRSQGGLGVGLTLARRLAQMHGGNIEAVSAGAGRGSEFVVRLPFVGLVRLVETAPAAARSAPPPSCRVLVVDDNHDAAESLASFLDLLGHEVRTAADGGKALEVAGEFEPQIIVLDIGLPVLDGYEVARRLRMLPALKDALLLALSGYGQKEDRSAAEAAGFDEHFVKPVDPASLASRMDDWLQKRSTAATRAGTAHS